MAVSDVLDGTLARRLHQVSRLGAALDPVADRLTIATVTITLLVMQVLPAVLVALLAARDLIIAVLVLGVFRGRLPRPVTKTGKLATAGLLFGIPTITLGQTTFPGATAVWIFALIVLAVATALYYLALLQYLAAWRRQRRRNRPVTRMPPGFMPHRAAASGWPRTAQPGDFPNPAA
jgi:cardiolipin synthase